MYSNLVVVKSRINRQISSTKQVHASTQGFQLYPQDTAIFYAVFNTFTIQKIVKAKIFCKNKIAWKIVKTKYLTFTSSSCQRIGENTSLSN